MVVRTRSLFEFTGDCNQFHSPGSKYMQVPTGSWPSLHFFGDLRKIS